MDKTTRQYADRLANILSKETALPSSVRELLNAVEQDGSLEAKQVINHPQQRHGGRTAVHIAANNGLWECLELLLKNGGDPNATSSVSDLCQTPLHLAASSGRANCLQVLLAHHADMDRTNSQRLTPQDLAKGVPTCERVFEQLIARTRIPFRTKREDDLVMNLHQLVQDPKREADVYKLLDSLPEGHLDLSTRWTDFYQLTLLTRACKVGSVGIVQYLLSKSPSEPLPCLSTGDTPLLCACRHGDVAMATLLLNHLRGLLFKCDELDCLFPLHVACSRGNSDMVRLLLEHFKELALDPSHPDMAGGRRGKLLDLNFKDRLGRTPLFNACFWGHHETVDLLLKFAQEHQDAVDLAVSPPLTQSGRTPLHAAVCKGDLSVVRMLVGAGADVAALALPSTTTHRRLLRAVMAAQTAGRRLPSPVPPPPSPGGGRSATTEKVAVLSSSEPSAPSHLSGSPDSRGRCRMSPDLSATPPGLNATPPSSRRRGCSISGTVVVGSPSGQPDECFVKTTPMDAPTFLHPLPNGPLPPPPPAGTNMEREGLSCEEGGYPVEVYQTSTGTLEVRPLDPNAKVPPPPNHGVDFGHLMVTPLVEACVHGHHESVRVLLEGGAQDSKGLGCRVALLAGRPDLTQLVLSYHCQPYQRKAWSQPEGAVTELELDWSEKRLPLAQGEWFNERRAFHAALHHHHHHHHHHHPEAWTTAEDEGQPPNVQSYSPSHRISHIDVCAIRCVHLQRNSLKEVPLQLFCLQSVLVIDLSDNQIAELPEACDNRQKCPTPSSSSSSSSFASWGEPPPQSGDHLPSGGRWRCVQLERLLLSHNHLVRLPWCLWALESLVYLEASHNKIKSLPQGGEELSKSIEDIDLSHNELEMVPKFLFELPCVKTVLLDHNRVESIPETVWTCGTLRELNLAHNRLMSLPWCEPETSLMPSQQEVGTGYTNLVKNSRQTLGVKVEVMSLRPGSVSGNQAVPAMQENPGVTEGCDYSSLVKLDLSHNQLTHFPEALPCLAPNLAELDVSWNQLETVDVQFVPQSLQKFVAKDCGLRHFGTLLDVDMYWQVTKNCRHGMTFGLPCQHRSHRTLPFLSMLSLQRNRLTCLQLLQHQPARGGDPGEEETVFVTQSSSPELLYPVLEGLDLTSNDLRGIFNPNVGHQAHLRWIKLDGNHMLERIPMEFAYLKGTRQFTELSLCDLPNLVEPTKEYQLAGLNHLLNYMKSRLKESVQYKTLKLLFIGKGERGKTTLLRRLKNLPHEKVARTTGIDIEDWYYPEVTKGLLKRTPKDKGVHFVVWDLSGQDVYQATHQSLYSRRSLYLAVFRLTDGPSGVDELDPWLRNVQFRAPGCPVIIVATHLDMVAEQRALELEKLVQSKYQDTRIYPKVVAVVSVSIMKRGSNSIDRLRRLIYEVSCRLQLSSDGASLEYKKNMAEDDPRALFQEQVPLSFLEFQKAIKKEVATRAVTGNPPVMMEEEFRKTFGSVCEDEDELQDAVCYLHLQGTLLHFEDVALRSVYFLDPLWLTKLITNVLNPSTTNIGSLAKDGVVEVSKLFEAQSITPLLKDKYVQLLEKFEVALQVTQKLVIVPSMMLSQIEYPLAQCPAVDTSDITQDLPHPPQRTLRRLWLSDYVPEAFWPRLICRVAVDQNVCRLVGTVTGSEGSEGLNWVPWKTGVAYVCAGRTLLVVKQQANEEGGGAGQFRIEAHVYTPEWVALSSEGGRGGKDPGHVLPLVTNLLVVVSQHILVLALDWFPGMLLGHPKPSTYVPCWKCYEAVDCTTATVGDPPAGDDFIFHNQTMVHCFDVDQCVAPAVLGKELTCVFHNGLEVLDMVPDLVFWDLQCTQKASNGILKITENEVLGKGGYGVVCKGELTENEKKQNVAVKIFMQNVDELLETRSIRDVLKESREPRNLLYAYHQIRQEVSFLSNLNHPNLTELCGVKTQPMCLLLELAPKRSLRSVLKEYKEIGQSLEPLTLKVTVKQIAEALEYLHDRHIVHLDVKSPNVLVWHFPLATLGRRERIHQAGNILLKLADYGISQVSTGVTIRVVNNPVGTPGFIAPEMFGSVKEVSADKLDVFAFGMTIYELLSFKAPFENIEPVAKRNHLVKDGQRPSLKGKELRNPVLLQELMVQCWSQNPDDRPKMRDVGRWVSSQEFERLRAQVYLKDVKTISCACVCRITPEQERREMFPFSWFPGGGGGRGVCSVINSRSVEDSYFDDVMTQCPEASGECSFLPPVTEPPEETGEETKGITYQDEGGEGHREAGVGGASYPGREGQIEEEVEPVSTAGEDAHNQLLDPYTQIWLCGRGKCKGLVQIFTYHDGRAGSYTFTGYLSKEEVLALCPVRNMMWLGTSSGKLKVYHAPTLKCKYVGQLTTDKTSILDIVHIKEVSVVMVTTSKGDIWVFNDQLQPQGLLIEEQLCLGEELTLYHLTKVVVQGCLEVWGSTGNSCLVVLDNTRHGWSTQELPCDPGNSKLRLMAFVVHCRFHDSYGRNQNHIWASYWSRAVMVTWDAQTRKQRGVFDCAKMFRAGDEQSKDMECSTNILSLAASGGKLFVGTSGGCVGVVDSETCEVLKVFAWHQGKVRTLLVLPKEVEACLCAEVPIVEQPGDQTTSAAVSVGSDGDVTSGDPTLGNDSAAIFPKDNNPLFVPNVEPDACMVTSIGNGRRQFRFQKSSAASKTLVNEEAVVDDVYLLTWKAHRPRNQTV